MKYRSARPWTLLAALAVPSFGSFAQNATNKHEPVASPPRLRPHVVLKGHADDVHNANFSPDGSRIVTTSKDGTARLWDIDGRLLAVLEGHTGIARGGRFSPDGSRILTWSREDTARLWDSEGNQIAALAGEVYGGSFSPDGSLVATTSYSFANDLTARLWDSNGNEVARLEGHTDWVIGMTFSADGSRILTTSNDGTARLWDMEGEPLAVLSHDTGENDARNDVWNTGFSPDGSHIITYSFDYTVRLWDSDGNAIAVLPGPPRWPSGGTPYSPDGSRFVTASNADGTAHVYDSEWKQIVELVGHAGPVLGAGFSPDGRRILTTSRDRTARLWDSEGKPVAVLVGHTGLPYGTFSPDGSRIITHSDDSNDRTARLWDSDGRLLAVFEGLGKFSPDGSRIVAAHEDTARLYLVPVPEVSRDVPASTHGTPDDQESIARHASAKVFGALGSPVISADGAWIAAEARSERGDTDVRVWSTEGNITYTIERGQNPRIGRDSRWVSARQAPAEESRASRAGRTLELLDLQGGSRRTFDHVLSYEVASASAYLIYLLSPEADHESTMSDEPSAGTLHLVHLESDTVSATIEDVGRYVTHQPQGNDQTTNHLAFVSSDKDTGRDTLNIIALGRTSGWGYRGSYEGGTIDGLRWARDAITLGFIDSTEIAGKDGERRVNSALYMWHVAGPNVLGSFTRVDVPQ